MDELLIRTSELIKRYGETTVVDRVSLEVRAGEIFGLVGPNGAGKTTTIRMLMGLSRPNSGQIEILGRNVARAGPELRASVGYVAEDQAVYGYMTAGEHLAFASRFYPTWDRDLAGELLGRFGLPAHRRAGELSKGMRSQLALIMALAPRPPLLILDEPTSGLDPIARREFLSILMAEAAGPDRAVLMSSHILTEVERAVDRVGFMVRGKLAAVKALTEMAHQQKRVRVVFQGEPPPGILEQPGIVGVRREGHGYLLTVESEVEQIMASLQAAGVFALDLMDMDLEQTLLHYAGGDRRER